MVARLSSSGGGEKRTPRQEAFGMGAFTPAPLPRPDREDPSSAHSTSHGEAHRASAIGSAHSQALHAGRGNDSEKSGKPPSLAAKSHAFAASDNTKSPYPESYAADALPREVEGLDISTYSNLKHAFEIIVHSYKLQKEALEANRRRWGDERQGLLTREQHLVEVLCA